MQGIYVHIPFCAAKCLYCDFHSVVADEDFVGNYLTAFQQEIAYYAQRSQGEIFDTLFIGGGTPTILSATQLYTMVSQLLNAFAYSGTREITIEANPKTLTQDKIVALQEAGINRISLGVQAFQDPLLHRIGRIHKVDDVWHTLELFAKVGLTNFNLDLIFGLPGQTVADWQYSLEQAIKANPSHLSCYSLIVEDDTPFATEYQQGTLDLPEEDTELAMFSYTKQFLPSKGYNHYEISNYAKLGYTSRHNTIYWLNQPYLALGSGAHGYWDGKRYANTKNMAQYIQGWLTNNPALDYQETITVDQAMDETMMVGMRLLAGVDEQRFIERFGLSYYQVYGEQIKELQRRGLVRYIKGKLQLTEDGLYLGNQVFSTFIR